MESYDVVIVGGGVIGASVAWHLAVRGCTRVLVLDAAPGPGQGSTGRATGGFRVQFGSEPNVRLSLLAREKLLRFQDEVGVDPGYHPCGYLFLTERQETLAALLEAQAMQRSLGVTDARRVTVDEALGINPAVAAEGLVGGVYCPTDGFIRPLQMLAGYTEAARGPGVRFEYGAAVRGMRVEGGRVAAVRTDAGEVAAGAVVNAAGAWAGKVAAMAGADVPVTPLRRQVALSEPFAGLPECMPLTIFVEAEFHLRVRDGRVLMLWSDQPNTADPFDTTFDDAWLPQVAARAHRWIPCLREARVDRAACVAGLYEMSPDRHVLLGPAPGVENLFLANGSSGHGVMHSPALGQLVAEMIVDGAASSMDVHPLRPSRFAEGQPNAAPEFL
ncbi:MAG TPA: FAD-binding oxidoreductase [Longimicrobium sp.]|uniref:NAD(P)/FAD-dependent oxidoreductase n=1 Tax=Longimicrobium sp. TaxID=2029185 RepID=UPI002ED81F56